MSLKYHAQQVEPNHYILPQVGGMKVEAHAFLSEALYDASDEGLWQQVANGASYEGVIGAYLMPDTHLGFGVPIGSVIVTEDTIIQAGSGYDISCFTGDTKVPLVDGRELTFHELVEEYGDGEPFYVYSVTEEGRVTAGKAHHPRRTRTLAQLVEVSLDNGERVTCTPDHRFLLRDGTYRRAEDLAEGSSLMPLYRTYDNGYCVVQHPSDNSQERMYKVSFREEHGYVPEWPNIIHHDLFHEYNSNPSKTNDDPRFLVEMDQADHFKLHAETAKERLRRGEIWGARAHQLYPEMYSKMASENMHRLHADPEFRKRHAKRMSEMNRKVRERGGYEGNWSRAGQRGKETLIRYNRSVEGRAKSAENGRNNKGRVQTLEARQKMLVGHEKARQIELPCPHCSRVCKGKGGLSRHIYWSHNNHKVVSVRSLSRVEDVYCMTVDRYENFALSAGVFVHNCGVLYMKVPGLTAEGIRSKEKRWSWINEVEKRIATGTGSQRPSKAPRISHRKIDDILHYGVKPLGVSADLCERQYIPVAPGIDLNKIEKARNKAHPQLGSVGGGNHFIEMQCDQDTGEVWVMIHCGSRGYGWQTANHFFYEGARLRGLPTNRREDSWLRADEPLGAEYWAYHNTAANYAVANRHIIVHGIQEALDVVFGVQGKVYYEISHNLVQEETLVLPDGSTKKGFVHRKGATRAFPAGHPDLVGTVWEKTGHPCLIPGSMYSGAAIMFPEEGAYKSGCSVNHGSGRVMARGQAKKNLAHKQDVIDQEMATVLRSFGGIEVEGIVGNTKKTPLDECGHVYKDLDAVLDVLEANGVAKVAHRLFPVANLKGVD